MKRISLCFAILILFTLSTGTAFAVDPSDFTKPADAADRLIDECLVAAEDGLLDRAFKATTDSQRRVQKKCHKVLGDFDRFCVVNFDGDSAGTGATGVELDGLHSYSSVYAYGTTDDEIRDDILSRIAANSFFVVTPVGDTTLVIEPATSLGIGCGPIRDDGNALVGTDIFDWDSILVLESDPYDSTTFGDFEINGSEPWTDVFSSFSATSWWGSGTYSSGLDSDQGVCAGLYFALPGFWQGVGYTALVQEATDPTISCSSNDPNMRLACVRVDF